MKYLIVLFKNKERKKIIKKFKTFENAKKFYDKMIKENTIVFNKEVENGKDCFFELGLMEKIRQILSPILLRILWVDKLKLI